MAGAADVETLIGQVWGPDVRPLAEEAWRSYNAGAIRASIAATWTAVTADLIGKLIRLAEDGDAAAASFRAKVDQAQEHGLSATGVREMQKIEDSLLQEAEKFELIDSIGARELERIREDRNLCVHPSLRSLGDIYEPRPEVARGHLAVALNTLLTHPPTQGRKAIAEFTTYICDPLFTSTAYSHIQTTFFDRVRSATRRNIVKVAAKHALLEIPPPSTIQLSPAEHADRMAAATKAFAWRDRGLVRDALADESTRFQLIDTSAQLRALVRLGDQDFFWDMIDQPLADRFNQLLSALAPVARWDPLPADAATYFALVRSPIARQRLPSLEQRFATMEDQHQMNVCAAQPDPYFVPLIIKFLRNAGSWRMGERAGQVAVLHVSFFAPDDLKAVLSEWASNFECRTSAPMPNLAVDLFHNSTHLGASRADAFRDFLKQVRSLEDADSNYTYPTLETAMRSAGYM